MWMKDLGNIPCWRRTKNIHIYSPRAFREQPQKHRIVRVGNHLKIIYLQTPHVHKHIIHQLVLYLTSSQPRFILRNLSIHPCSKNLLLYSCLDFYFIFWAFLVKYLSPAESQYCIVISDWVICLNSRGTNIYSS